MKKKYFTISVVSKEKHIAGIQSVLERIPRISGTDLGHQNKQKR